MFRFTSQLYVLNPIFEDTFPLAHRDSCEVYKVLVCIIHMFEGFVTEYTHLFDKF